MKRKLNLEIFIDENLQGRYKEPDDARVYVLQLEVKQKENLSSEELARLLGNIGAVYLHLRELHKAEEFINKSIDFCLKLNLNSAIKAQQTIRLANIFQWKKNYHKANELYLKVIKECRSLTDCEKYLDFALQHYGKCLFDQLLYNEAISQFEEAVKIRIDKQNLDLIESSKIAIRVSKKRLKNDSS